MAVITIKVSNLQLGDVVIFGMTVLFARDANSVAVAASEARIVRLALEHVLGRRITALSSQEHIGNGLGTSLQYDETFVMSSRKDSSP